MANEYRVEMKNIVKRFGGVLALNDVSFRVRPGEVHALVGENGAGKSTLMKILSGAYQKDEGTIFIDGKEEKISSPKEAKELGVATIYQEFMLAPHLTVAENIFIDRLSDKGKFINWKDLNQKASEILDQLGFGEINAKQRVENLSVAYQQVVEICKNLTRNAKILVLDEPTAVLTFTEIEKLFSLINKLKNDGVSIIYISHRLEEIFQICDRITVLKDGTFVKELNTTEVNKGQLVNLMVGRDMSTLFPSRAAKIGDVVLEVKNLNRGKMVRNVSFSVRAGEVLGFSGLVGAGRTETMRAIFGADKKESGEIWLNGEQVNFKNPREAVKKGLGLLPEDRKQQGVLLEQSIRVNTTLSALRKITQLLGIINFQKDKKLAEDVLAELATKYNSIEDNTSSLSGGNQQKVALAKWLVADCKCIILDEPTRGVDVGAKVEIYKNINDLAEQGVAIVMISSEMTEIIGMCDRALIMRQGMVVGELDRSELAEDRLIRYSMGVNENEE
ncbi:sugar ABC transporter ATP-binding protein [Bariatricus sp. SGI.161]|uniref:sugar ABC transporter ATP-binding protein n=1 Tax=Bariatricus sp. SGI.161 TaxID=3420550 RepID=UPI003D00CDEE